MSVTHPLGDEREVDFHFTALTKSLFVIPACAGIQWLRNGHPLSPSAPLPQSGGQGVAGVTMRKIRTRSTALAWCAAIRATMRPE